jgi:DNA-binding CsgD family transcriptional regulator
MSLMLEDGQEHSAEIFEKNLNGVFLISVSPFLDGESNLAGGIHVARDITQLKAIEDKLRESNEKLEQRVAMRTSELVQKARDLEDANIALKVLLNHRELDRTEIQESVTRNIKEQIFPHLDRMEHGILSKEQLNACIGGIRSTFEDGVSLFIQFLSGKGLSPAEVRIAEMIRAGKTNKEIADSISISEGTVRTHREHIRSKLGLTNQKTNLRAYLQAHQ